MTLRTVANNRLIDGAKLDNITVTQPVNLDTIESGIATVTADLSAHTSNVSNPHSVTKSQVGLGNADNTSDANKPISSATQTALDSKQDTLVSGTNIKTINSTSILGSGDIVIAGTGSVTEVSSANTDIGVATGTTTPVLTLNSGTGANQIVKLDGTAKLPAIDGSQLTNLPSGGNVSKVGTPVNNQVGVWTGDGTIEGDVALTFDTTTDTLTSGTFNSTALTASELTATDASKNIVSLPVSTYPSLSEVAYLKGVTSAIQTQLNTKGAGDTISPATNTDSYIPQWNGADSKTLKNGIPTSTFEPAITAGTTSQYIRGDKSLATFQTDVIANKKLRNLMSTSLLSGGVMTINADPTKFDIPTFTAVFVDNYTDPLNPTYTEYVYPGSTGNVVTNLTTQDATYIAIGPTGTIYQTATNNSGADSRDKVTLGSLIHTSRTQIDIADPFINVNGFDIPASIGDISNAIGIINSSGNIFSANGANLKINKSAGSSTQVGLNWKNSKKNPNTTTDLSMTAPTFTYSWRNGTGGFNTSSSSDIDVNSYDNGTGGALVPAGTVGSTQWTIQRIYYSPDAHIVVIEFGQALYSSSSVAEAALFDPTVVNPEVSGLSFRGWILTRGGTTALNGGATQAIFRDANKFGTTTAGGGSGSSTTTLQQAYDNSTTPEILTDATRGAFTVKRGSGADTDTTFEGQNGAGTVTSSIDGNGKIFSGSLTASEILITDASKNIVSAPVATYPSLAELAYVKGVTSAIQTQLNAKQSTITFGTGVQTALGVNVGTAGSPVINGGALGTPSSGTLTNCTFPTLNQNTTGTSSNVTGIVAIANGGTGSNSLAGASIPTYTSTNTFSTGIKTFLNGMFALRNVANTFSGFFTNTNTADRTYTLKDASGTLAFTTDITGTNSGTNTGDQTITLTGDVTGSGTGSFAATLANTSVTPGSYTLSSITVDSKGRITAASNGTAGGTGDMILANAQTNSGAKTFLNATMLLRNVANTFSSYFTNTNTAARTYTLKDADGTLAFTSDITGTNSGTNTGDVTLAGTPDYITIVGQVITRALINLTSHVTGILPSANGGTANGFTKFTGPTTAEKTFTLPDASSTLLYSGGALGTPSSGTLTNATGLPAASIVAGIIGTTGARMTKVWATDIETTNMPTVGGTAILSSLTAPQFTTIELGHASDTTLSRVSAGVVAVEGVTIPTISSTSTLTNKTLTKPIINGTDPTGATYTPATGAQTVALDCAANNMHIVTGHANGTAITFTVANATNNQPFIVSILQGGTTVSTITAWFATIRWAGGSAPTLTATLNKRDTFGFIRTGANTYDGFVIGQNC